MKEPTIVKVYDLLRRDNLVIPEYQRPYKWTIKNVGELLNDILLYKEKNAYRLGTLVLHETKDKDENLVLNIVDGQQRTLTLTLIAMAIIEQKSELLEKIDTKKSLEQYMPKLLQMKFKNEISQYNIWNNYREIQRRVREFDKQTILFFFNKCELVEVTLTDVSEAFQFFDSQNARGKDLEPHDLLKAFHLREMNNLPEPVKKESIVEWENMPTIELSSLFGDYLYRIRNWSRSQSARYFTKNDVDVFKGISPYVKQYYPFTQLPRIAHFYVEQYNSEYHRNIDDQYMEYPFQLAEPIINGKRFFEMISHYKKSREVIRSLPDTQNTGFQIDFTSTETLSGKIFSKINSNEDYPERHRTGDKYVRNIFDCAVMMYIDKFGTYEFHRIVEKLFILCFSLRLRRQAVQLASADNHVIGGINIFKIIRDAVSPQEILGITLPIEPKEKYKQPDAILSLFKELKYYNE
ncbi:MAG: DUF262 domain-containing protein [Bacteroidota bacterium]